MQRCPHCNEGLDDGLVPICWHCGRDTRADAAHQISENAFPPPEANGAQPIRAPGPVALSQAAASQLGKMWRRWQLPLLGVAALAVGAALAFMARPSSHAVAAAPSVAPRSAAAATAPADRPASEPVEIDKAPAWVVPRAPRSAVNGSRIVTLQLEALRAVMVRGERIRPVLGIRCLGGRTEVFVALGTSASIEASEGHTVTIRFDEEAPATERWESSSTYQEIFAPDGLTLARRLTRTGTLEFGFTPYNSRLVSAQFIVRGLDRHIDSVARLCRWDDRKH